MPKWVIEREVPGAGKLSLDEIQAISQKSCSVVNKLGPQIQWLHSYVTDNRLLACGSPRQCGWQPLDGVSFLRGREKRSTG